MKKIILILIIPLSLYISCKKDKENNNNDNSNALLLTYYPLKIGNEWEYHTEINVTDTTGEINMHLIFDDYWKVISDTIINGIKTYKVLQIDSNRNYNYNSIDIKYTYYANKPDGFYVIAFKNFGSFIDLKKNFKIKFLAHNPLQFSEQNFEDSLIIYDSPIRFLKFPSILNTEWLFARFDSTVYTMRKYENYQTVTTDIGNFNCIKLKIYDVRKGNEDTTFKENQYFNEKGLIEQTSKRSATNEQGNKNGYIIQTTKLVKINF